MSFEHLNDLYGYITDGRDKINDRMSLDNLSESAI